jgi:hypothetical protein
MRRYWSLPVATVATGRYCGKVTTPGVPSVRIGPSDVLRFVLELFALFSLGFWGYLAWPFPWPGVLFMVGAPLFAAVVWGLFRSPKALFPLDVVGRSLVEIFVMGAAVAVWFMIGYPVVGVIFGIVAVISGVITGRAEIAAEATA